MSEYSENDKKCDEYCECNEKQGLLKDASVILAAAIVILGGLHSVRSILGPIFLAAFFAAMLTSPMRWLRSKGWTQSASLTTVILFVMLIGGGTITVVGSQLKQFAEDVPAYRDQFNGELAKYNIEIGDFLPFLKEEKKAKSEEDEQEKRKAENDASLALQRRVRAEVDRALSEKSERTQRGTEEEKNALGTDKPTRKFKREAAPITQVAYQTQDFETTRLAAEDRAVGNAEIDGVAEAVPLTEAAPEETTGEIAETLESFAQTKDQDGATLGDDEATDESNPADEFAATTDESDEEAAFEVEAAFRLPDPTPTTGVEAASNELFSYLLRLTNELTYFASNSFIVTLLVIFMLCETTSMPKKMIAALGKRSFVNEHIQHVIADIRNYMVIKTWMSLGVGFFVTLLLFVSDVQYPLLWGFVAFLLNYIPNIGSVVAAIPPIVLATVEHGLFVGVVDAIFFVIINCTIGYAIEPRLLGNGLDLSPLIVLIALILFGWLLGPIGMFLSPPLAVIMKIIFQSFPETRWIAVLMANRPPKDDEPDGAEANA